MKTICIGDYISAISEKTTENNQHIVLTSSRNGIFIQNEYFNKKVASVDTTGYKIIRKGQFTYRAMSDTGRFYINRLKEYNIGIVSPAYPVFEVKKNDSLYPEYLLAFFHSPYFQSLIATQSTGSTRVSLKLDKIKKIKLSVPPLDVQRRIAETLDKVTELISLRKTQLEKLDELVKARFVEMFGDPVLNPKDWECKTVIDECDCMVPGRDKPKSFTGDIPWITIEDLAVNGVTYESKRGLGLTQEEIDEVNRKTIPKGSVIMSCVGNLGICSIAGKEMIINQQLHSFQCGERINNVFLMNYLGYRKDFMNKWASNTTVLYMNKSICNSIPVIIPPIELQEQFAAFVEQTDKAKAPIQQSLDALETLKKSLMQEYFG